jgi:hypothetical protein
VGDGDYDPVAEVSGSGHSGTDVLFVSEFDQVASPPGAKWLGELIAVLGAPAIAAAVPHPTESESVSLPVPCLLRGHFETFAPPRRVSVDIDARPSVRRRLFLAMLE